MRVKNCFFYKPFAQKLVIKVSAFLHGDRAKSFEYFICVNVFSSFYEWRGVNDMDLSTFSIKHFQFFTPSNTELGIWLTLKLLDCR